MKKLNRKRPASGVELDHGGPTLVFLTVCTKNRSPWLASEVVHKQLRTVWAQARAWLVGRYVIMPDHVHLFVELNEAFEPFVELDAWVRYWKSQFSKRHSVNDHRWQADYWDRRLRREENFDEKWEYVRGNPVRHGLVLDEDEWPFQGEIADLRWE